jgi:hypothetical protein
MRCVRRSGLTVLVFAADAGKTPRLTEHRFTEAKAEEAFVARFRLEMHNKGLVAAPAAKRFDPGTTPAVVRHHAAPSASRTRAPARLARRAAPRRARAADVRASAFRADARETALAVRPTVAALRDAGAEVRARLGRPASARSLARLEAAFGTVPPSLRAILEVHDGFDVRWSVGRHASILGRRVSSAGTHVTCTWLSITAMLAERTETLLPLIRQYDGAIVGLDTSAPRGGELRVVFRDRLDERPRGIASSAGACLATLLRDAFTHPGIPDVARAPALELSRSLR